MTSFPTYVPAFSTRENEIRAYVHADTAVKDNMLPLVTLTGDPGGEGFDGNLATLLGAADGRPLLLDFDPNHKVPPNEKAKERAKQKREEERLKKGKKPYVPTEAQLALAKKMKDDADNAREAYNNFIDKLLSPADGYAEWRDFSLKIPNAIPVIQLSDQNEAKKHVAAIASVKRPVAFRVDVNNPSALENLVFAVGGLAEGGQLVVVLDAKYIRRDPLSAVSAVTSAATEVRKKISQRIALTLVCLGGSFPPSLEDMPNPLTILEADVFNRVKNQDWNLVYGDYSSVSHREPSPFNGTWRPHVEVCHHNQWHYSRAERNSKGAEVSKLAQELVNNPEIWSGRAVCWGTEMIKHVADGNLKDTDGKSLTIPGPWISIRVNQHLTRQALARAPGKSD